MHALRALALQYKIMETSTIERIKRLNDRGIFDRKFAAELIESFDILSSILLEAKLQAIVAGKTAENSVDIRELGKIERESNKKRLKETPYAYLIDPIPSALTLYRATSTGRLLPIFRCSVNQQMAQKSFNYYFTQ